MYRIATGVFPPVIDDFETEESAKAFLKAHVEKTVREMPHFPKITNCQIFAEDIDVVLDFIVAKVLAVDPEPKHIDYRYTILNVDTKEVLGRVFSHTLNDKTYGFKVKDGRVFEWYEEFKHVPGEPVWHALNMETGAVEERYYIENTSDDGTQYEVVKYNLAGAKVVTSNCVASMVLIPDDFKADLAWFPHLSNVFLWARKSYGRIVEFVETPEKDTSLVTPEMKLEVAKLIDDFVPTMSERVRLAIRVQMLMPDDTWFLVDTRDWLK